MAKHIHQIKDNNINITIIQNIAYAVHAVSFGRNSLGPLLSIYDAVSVLKEENIS